MARSIFRVFDPTPDRETITWRLPRAPGQSLQEPVDHSSEMHRIMQTVQQMTEQYDSEDDPD